MDVLKLLLVIEISYLSTVFAVPGDCTFENGMCGYTQDNHDNFDWSNKTGKTPSRYTGPTEDHTTGSGTYMYIETSWPRLNKEKACLISPAISDTVGNCLYFYYHMNGLNVRSLNIYTQETSGSRTLRWSLSGNQKSHTWSFARLALPTNRKNLKIVLEGNAGTGWMGDVAIDDIKVYENSSCDIHPPEAKPTKPVPPPPDSKLPDIPLCGITPTPVNTRIVGGMEASPGAWPWQAMLMYKTKTKEWKQFCGGSLITPKWVVTASHCVNDIRKEDYLTHKIRMGAHYRNKTTGVEQDLGIERIYIHPDYNGYPVRYDHDIALIKLNESAILNNTTQLVCLPDDSVQFPAETYCYITGWGTLTPGGNKPNSLQQAKVALVSRADCTKKGSYDASVISDKMLCAGIGGKDTCQGDSGGPLVCKNSDKWYLVGVTSWGNSCAHPKYPGVYANVPELKQWLANGIANPV